MIRWIRRMFFCRRGKHRITVGVDHATLTAYGCRDCGRRFKLSELPNGTRVPTTWSGQWTTPTDERYELSAQIMAAEAEIEQLKAEIEQLHRLVELRSNEAVDNLDEAIRLRAENEALRTVTEEDAFAAAKSYRAFMGVWELPALGRNAPCHPILHPQQGGRRG